jgi:mRNA-degrading endonuclease toxin of MazEF toxin-antitoxin module
LILLDRIRTIDKARLAKRSGTISAAVLGAALTTLAEIFAA